MEQHYEKLAKILRIQPDVLHGLEQHMAAVTGRQNVIERIYIKNETLVNRLLDEFYLMDPTYQSVSQRIVDRLDYLDLNLQEVMGHPSLYETSGCGKLCETAARLADGQQHLFLKTEKAKDILRKFPPQEIISFLGYSGVDELLEKEDVFEIYSALRFVETTEWMHNFFAHAYHDIMPNDFEPRDIKIFVLGDKWMKAAEQFMHKKYHNVSHLKELGVIFIIPISLDSPGELTRLMTLLLHYKNEVTFYTELFQQYFSAPDFNARFQSLLRGDVVEGDLPQTGFSWRIVQRYLTKTDPNDPRLFEPHINPEAMHWYLAEEDLSKLSAEFPGTDFGFWKGLDWVGDFFPQDGNEKLVSFNLIDTVMSLVEKEQVVYLYHHQEALWNQIFIEYFSLDQMRQMLKENFDKGYINFAV